MRYENESQAVQAEYSALNAAIGEVLFHVTNFPEAAQTRLLGQDMGPLREKLVNAVWNAGFISRQTPLDDPNYWRQSDFIAGSSKSYPECR